MIPLPILGLDGAAGNAVGCLITPRGVDYAESDANQPHSQAILPMIQRLLDAQRLSPPCIRLFALGLGPGSFTGLRVAAASLSGLNASLKRPMLGVSSLRITAFQADLDDELWVIEDARGGDAYIGRYCRGQPVDEDRCLPWHEVRGLPPLPYVSLGTLPISLPGWQRLPLRLPRPKALAECILSAIPEVDVASLGWWCVPKYLRPSQAERKLVGP